MPRPLPVPTEPIAIPGADPLERVLVRRAAIAAVALHAAILLLPWRAEPPVLPSAPDVRPIEVVPYRIRPPQPVRPRTEAPATGPRLLPVPATLPSELLEPIDSPPVADAPEVAALEDGWPDLIPGGAPPVADVPAVVDESEPGLALPVRVSGSAPAYPPLAIQARKEGVVVLQAVISPAGEVVGLRVVSAPRPDLGLSSAAIEAVRAWRYRPGVLRGRTVAVRLTVRVTFHLNP